MFEMRDLLLLGIMESKLPLAIAIQSLKGKIILIRGKKGLGVSCHKKCFNSCQKDFNINLFTQNRLKH